MITWGIVLSATAFVWDARSFYVVRFLLGVFEAGFLPGIMLYITQWIPEKRRGEMIALLMLAGPICTVFASPLSALLLNVNGLGLHGWQWLFLIEGAPSCILGIVVLFYMTDKPKDAPWLEPEERNWLTTEIEKTRSQSNGHSLEDLAQRFEISVSILLGLL